MRYNTTGSSNTATGYFSLANNTDGTANVAASARLPRPVQQRHGHDNVATGSIAQFDDHGVRERRRRLGGAVLKRRGS